MTANVEMNTLVDQGFFTCIPVEVQTFHLNGLSFDIDRLADTETISWNQVPGFSRVVVARRGDGGCPLTAW